MSQQLGGIDKSFVAGTDLSTKQYYIVKMAGSGTPYGVILTSARTDVAIGILQNEPTVNEAALVRIDGTSKVIIGTPIAIGGLVTMDASGKGYTGNTDKDIIIGIALETGAADGDIIEILLTHFKASI